MKDTTNTDSTLAARATYIRHLVLAALCVITTINYIQRNSLGGAETTVRADLHLEPEDTGDAQGAFFLTYALCQVPSGWLAQRWGGGRALIIFAAGWSLVMAFTASVTNLPVLLGARGFMGALQAGIFPCCTLILALWYPITRRGFASAVLTSFMLMGGVIGSWMTALLIGPLGWRWLFLLYAVPGLVWAAWFALWFRNRPQDHPQVNAAELAIITSEGNSQKDTPKTGKISWLAIFFSWALWMICIQQFCRAGAMRFFDFRLPTYLQEVRGQTVEEANYWTSLPLIAGVLGSLVGGVISDFVLARTQSRRAGRQGVAVGAILLSLLFYGLAYPIGNLTTAILLASFGLFIMNFSAPCAYAVTMDMGGRNLGIVFATMNMAGNLGSWAFTTFFPRIVRWQGWETALLVFVGMHVVAIVCFLSFNPNGVVGEQSA